MRAKQDPVEEAELLENLSEDDEESVTEQAPPGGSEIVPVEPDPVPLNSPDAVLVAHQIADSVPMPLGTDNAVQRQFMYGSVALYADIAPQDAFESVLARLLVGLANGGMDCFGRAARAGNWLAARDVNLKSAIKCTLAATEVVKVIDSHRGRTKQKVSVSQVNVQSGGQAIVGNVERRNRSDDAPVPQPLPLAAGGDSDDES